MVSVWMGLTLRRRRFGDVSRETAVEEDEGGGEGYKARARGRRRCPKAALPPRSDVVRQASG